MGFSKAGGVSRNGKHKSSDAKQQAMNARERLGWRRLRSQKGGWAPEEEDAMGISDHQNPAITCICTLSSSNILLPVTGVLVHTCIYLLSTNSPCQSTNIPCRHLRFSPLYALGVVGPVLGFVVMLDGGTTPDSVYDPGNSSRPWISLSVHCRAFKMA